MGTKWQKFESRTITLVDHQWVTFEMMGGEAWLRQAMANRHATGIAKRERNNRVKKDRAAGMSINDLAEKHKMHRSTIRIILSEKEGQQ